MNHKKELLRSLWVVIQQLRNCFWALGSNVGALTIGQGFFTETVQKRGALTSIRSDHLTPISTPCPGLCTKCETPRPRRVSTPLASQNSIAQ